MTQGIAITGAGIICSIGTDCSSVLQSLKDKKTGISQMQYLESERKELPVGEVKMSNDELKALLCIDTGKDISRTTLLGAVALKQAMADSGLTPEQLKGKRVVFISGTTVGGMDVTERHYANMLCDDAEAEYAASHDCGSNTKEIAQLCGLDCEMTTISTACSSALNAIIVGTRMLLADETDIVIAGGSEALSRFHLNGFNSLMILDQQQCRPFDASRQGLNLGEGAAYVVIERADEARKRNASAKAYIAGYGNRCDAYHQTATSETGTGAFLAMNDAFGVSTLMREDIDYVNAHGTGTPDNDKSESAALREIFGDQIPPVSSTKSFTGHTTSASGSIETVICLLAMQNDFIPANLGWTHSDDNCISPSQGAENVKVNNVICNSFGFGGNDSSIILSKDECSLMTIPLCKCKVQAESEVTADDDLKELRQYVPPMESRRMSKILKAAILTSMRAIEKANMGEPDAIVIATKYGMLEQGEKILDHICESGEEGISPTLFMQSTHNTIAGTLAIRLGCHGYNITYSQGDESLDWAIKEAHRLIAEKAADTVLVGLHDQCPEKFSGIIAKCEGEAPKPLVSKSMIITRDYLYFLDR